MGDASRARDSSSGRARRGRCMTVSLSSGPAGTSKAARSCICPASAGARRSVLWRHHPGGPGSPLGQLHVQLSEPDPSQRARGAAHRRYRGAVFLRSHLWRVPSPAGSSGWKECNSPFRRKIHPVPNEIKFALYLTTTANSTSPFCGLSRYHPRLWRDDTVIS